MKIHLKFQGYSFCGTLGSKKLSSNLKWVTCKKCLKKLEYIKDKQCNWAMGIKLELELIRNKAVI